MKTVQLSIVDSDYALLLRRQLVGDGVHRVYVVPHPDLRLDGLVVVDQENFSKLKPAPPALERFVVITEKGSEAFGSLWAAGVRQVVYEDDSMNTVQLSIIAAEMRLPPFSRR